MVKKDKKKKDRRSKKTVNFDAEGGPSSHHSLEIHETQLKHSTTKDSMEKRGYKMISRRPNYLDVEDIDDLADWEKR